MHNRPIKTQKDLDLVLQIIDQVWKAEEGTSEYTCFQLLSTLVEEYQGSHDPLEFASFKSEKSLFSESLLR